MKFKAKVVIVTGSGRGIGKQIARKFAEEGATVVIADVDAEAAKSFTNELADMAFQSMGIQVDITQEKQVKAMIEQVLESFGRIDILVNNAGVALNKPFLETSLEDWERLIRVNLTGTFICAQAVAREMVKNRYGKIVNIASISGQKGGQGRAAYGAAKAGIIQLTKVMAVELSSEYINVNAISPGPVDTDQSRECHTPATRKAYIDRIPMRRYSSKEEIAAGVLFLASDDSSGVSGHIFNVDGGFQMAGLIFQDDSTKTCRE